MIIKTVSEIQQLLTPYSRSRMQKYFGKEMLVVNKKTKEIIATVIFTEPKVKTMRRRTSYRVEEYNV